MELVNFFVHEVINVAMNLEWKLLAFHIKTFLPPELLNDVLGIA
jgi:hypothetical protein